MKRRELEEMIAGAAAVVALAVVLTLSYRGGAVEGGLGGYRLHATFNRIDGLAVGGDVLLGGMPVGTVESMTLDDNFRARLTMLMTADVELPTDTAAAIHTDGLFGSKFVSLNPGGSEEVLKDGDAITYTQDAVIVTDLLDLIISQGKAARNAKQGGS